MVTGANYLLEAGGLRLLVDCGLFQGSRFSEEFNYQPFSFKASEIDYVLVTHSHVDHMGRLPKLFKEGFRGKVIATEPTKGILEVALPDTWDKIKDEAQSMGHEPLYSHLDMTGLLRLIRGVEYAKPIKLNELVYVTFHEVSHILGAASIAISVHEGNKRQKVLFSGDIGNPPTLMLNPIDYVFDADYAAVESAYGDRLHKDRAERRDSLFKVVKETVERNGVLMIPSFALERTQELLLEFDTFFEKGNLPKVPIFVDSPLATRISHVYGRYSHYFNEAALALLKNNKGLLQFPWLVYTPTTSESKRINDIPSSKIIIAGSGMSQGGRILHHERRYLPDPKNTILFIGYQVNGSLGRKILDGQKQVSIFGEPVSVNCNVESISSYSAHADQTGLLEYVEKANSARRLKKVFVVQGEEKGAQVLGKLIREKFGVDAVVPNMHEAFDL